MDFDKSKEKVCEQCKETKALTIENWELSRGTPRNMCRACRNAYRRTLYHHAKGRLKP